MEIVPIDTRWDEFCDSSPDAWFWHTTDWQLYTLKYLTGSISLSFMVTENRSILAICPLILQDGEFSMFWSPAFAEMPDQKKERVANAVFEEVDRLASSYHVKRASFMIYPLSFPGYNFLMRHGYMDTSINTQVIVLNDIEEIRHSMRKGHSAAVNSSTRHMTIYIYDDIITPEIFERYHNMHTLDAGRETRDQQTWDMQYDWIKQGHAILLEAVLDKPVGYSYVFTYKDKAYYGSACSDPGYPNLSIGHVLNWKTIEWLYENCYTYYEIGWQQYGRQMYDFPSPKEVSIGKFKRGFGGMTIPLYRGEKYYSDKFLQDTVKERLCQYMNTSARSVTTGSS